MKKIATNKTGMQIFLPNLPPKLGSEGHSNALLLNAEGGNAISIVTSEEVVAAPPPPTTLMGEATPHNATRRLSRKASRRRSPRESMYEAIFEGNWAAAEALLKQDSSLVWAEITEMGDRPLHLAVFMSHTKFVQKLTKLVDPRDLGLLDGRGYTVCCYAAMTGRVEIAHMIMEENPNLFNTRNMYGTTPLQIAASYGNASMVSYFLKSAKLGDLYKDEWFDLLLVTLRSKMYDVALEILEKDASLAVMRDVEGTVLHVLAQMDISSGWKTGGDRIMQPDLWLLAERLWVEIQRLGRDSVLELMRNPPILHDAAKVGNVELINMITRAYPDLLWHIDNNDGCSIFHIAVRYRQETMLELIQRARNIKDFNAISEDLNGNNILHLAGMLVPLDGLKIVSEPDLQMQRELAWFKAVEAIVPPFFLEKRNGDGFKPRELFWMEHRCLLKESASHMKSTAESCMLIATIILTVVFAAAFTPPGGYHQETGIPILLKNSWFACFVIFEALALFSSTYCIIGFWSIISSNYEEDQFLILPNHLRYALSALLLSLFCAISAFMSTFFLLFGGERTVLVKTCMLSVYVWLVVGISFQFYKLCRKTNLLEHYSRMGATPTRYHLYYDSLLRRLYQFVASILFYILFYFKK